MEGPKVKNKTLMLLPKIGTKGMLCREVFSNPVLSCQICITVHMTFLAFWPLQLCTALPIRLVSEVVESLAYNHLSLPFKSI